MFIMAMNLIIFQLQSTILPRVFCYNSIVVLLMTMNLIIILLLVCTSCDNLHYLND